MGFPPPFVGVAEKVTDAPGQKGLDDAAMVIPAGNPVLTIIVIELDVAGLPETQINEELSVQLTTSPAAGKYVNREVTLACDIPLTYH